MVDGQLQGPVDRAQDLPGGEGDVAGHVRGGIAELVAQGQVGDEGAEPGAELVVLGARHAGAAGQRRDAPLREQPAVVDPAPGVGHDGEGPGVSGREQHRGQRVGQRHTTARLAEGGGRRERVAVGAGVELVDAEGSEGGRHLRRAQGGVVLGPPGGIDATERGEGLRGGGRELDSLVGEHRVHARPPPRSALDTIMRCTSMVPEATVAAWA